MRTEPESWFIHNLIEFRKDLNANPEYQRPPNRWSKQNEQLLIDSILRGYDIPKLYFAETSDPKFDFEIVDGQQRIRAIWKYYDNQIALPSDSEDFSEWDDLSGKMYRDLPMEVRKAFGRFKLSVVILRDTNRAELEDLFRRLQNGKRITSVEYRNSLSGDIRDFAVDVGDTHGVFPLTKIKKQNWAWRDLTDHVLCLEMAGGPADIKAPDLREMYETGQFPKKKDVRQKVKRTLNYMKRMLRDEPSFTNIKWGFVDLYLLISSLLDKYDLTDLESEFCRFYVTFEGERRKALKKDRKELASGSIQNRLLFDYLEAFETGAGKEENVNARNEVYREWFLAHLGRKEIELPFKDAKRNFDSIDRSVIWYLAECKCQECRKELPFEHMQADHIKPHARGGQTVLSNAQCLCKECNLKKSNKV